MITLKNSIAYAFVVGFYERLRWGDAFGRTSETNQDWNEAYDLGANFADMIWGRA